MPIYPLEYSVEPEGNADSVAIEPFAVGSEKLGTWSTR